MNKQACFDAAALVRAAALEAHAQQHGLHQTELQWRDPQRGPSPEAQPKDPAGRNRSITSRGISPRASASGIADSRRGECGGR